jgi:hypothetical protein
MFVMSASRHLCNIFDIEFCWQLLAPIVQALPADVVPMQDMWRTLDTKHGVVVVQCRCLGVEVRVALALIMNVFAEEME